MCLDVLESPRTSLSLSLFLSRAENFKRCESLERAITPSRFDGSVQKSPVGRRKKRWLKPSERLFSCNLEGRRAISSDSSLASRFEILIGRDSLIPDTSRNIVEASRRVKHPIPCRSIDIPVKIRFRRALRGVAARRCSAVHRR